MAAPRHAIRPLTRLLLRKYYETQVCSNIVSRTLCSEVEGQRKVDPEELFIRKDVQQILYQVTGFDLEKIFRKRLVPVSSPKYKLLTDEQLKQEHKEAVHRGMERLQMPPYLNCRKEDLVVLAEDSELEGHEDFNYVFTDVTFGLAETDQTIAIREPSGRLRLANWEERDRILQTYYPKPGRMHTQPKMFHEETLESMLHREKYEYVLDRACVQFEPDEPEYFRVTQRTYEHIASRNKFEDLWSTRHYGPMTFYLTLHNKIEGLLADMIKRDRVTEAAALVELYHVAHPTSKSAVEAAAKNVSDPQKLITLYATLSTAHGGEIELALQTYNEEPHAQTN